MEGCHFTSRETELLKFGNIKYIVIFIKFLAKVLWRQQQGRLSFYISHSIDKAVILVGTVLKFKSFS